MFLGYLGHTGLDMHMHHTFPLFFVDCLLPLFCIFLFSLLFLSLPARPALSTKASRRHFCFFCSFYFYRIYGQLQPRIRFHLSPDTEGIRSSSTSCRLKGWFFLNRPKYLTHTEVRSRLDTTLDMFLVFLFIEHNKLTAQYIFHSTTWHLMDVTLFSGRPHVA